MSFESSSPFTKLAVLCWVLHVITNLFIVFHANDAKKRLVSMEEKLDLITTQWKDERESEKLHPTIRAECDLRGSNASSTHIL